MDKVRQKKLYRQLRFLHRGYVRTQKMMMGIEPIKNIKRREFVQMLYDYGQSIKRSDPRGMSIGDVLSKSGAQEKLNNLLKHSLHTK